MRVASLSAQSIFKRAKGKTARRSIALFPNKSRGKWNIQGGALKQNTTRKFRYSLSLLSLLPYSLTIKGYTGVRRGDSSGFTVTATCTQRHGFERKSQGLFLWCVLSLKRLYGTCNDATRGIYLSWCFFLAPFFIPTEYLLSSDQASSPSLFIIILDTFVSKEPDY